ncbi:hypothetical protein E4U35_006309, partial [Claviceps purpurea]
AVYLFATRDSVHEMNYSRLRDANVPVLLLCARHSHPRYASISSKDFNDLTAELLLSIWARVTLTTNIWTEAGLVEGVAVTLSISVRRLEHLAIFADITLDDIRPSVTRALEVRRLDEENRAWQVLLPPLGPPMPRTPDLLTPRPLTFSTGASTGRRERERDREGTPMPRGR